MSGAAQTLCMGAEHPALAGHFPGTPIVPGVVLLDEVVQAVANSADNSALPPHWHISWVKFHRIVRPGDQLQLTLQARGDGELQFELHHGEQLIANGQLGPGAV